MEGNVFEGPEEAPLTPFALVIPGVGWCCTLALGWEEGEEGEEEKRRCDY